MVLAPMFRVATNESLRKAPGLVPLLLTATGDAGEVVLTVTARDCAPAGLTENSRGVRVAGEDVRKDEG